MAFSATATTRRVAIIALGLSRFCDSQEDFNDIAMTDASRCFRPFRSYSRGGGRLSPVGGGGTCPITCCSRRSAQELPGFDIDDPILPREIAANALRSGGYPYGVRMKRKEYKRQELPLQVELVKLQGWVQKDKAARHYLRVARRGGQSRDHHPLHAAFESAPCPRR